jgi:integrase
MGRKTTRGAISLINERGNIRMRWRYEGKRYSLTLFQNNKKGLHQAKKLALEIESDLFNDRFDTTLCKYKGIEPPQPVESPTKTMVEHFEYWVKYYKQLDSDRNTDYYHLRNTLRKWGVFNESTALSLLNKEAFGPKTYNNRLGILRNFSKWLVKQGVWSVDPMEEVSRKRVKKIIKPQRAPFSLEEISAILGAFKENTFCSRASRYPHSHYHPFIFFLFKTGVRPAEAIGLRVGSIDQQRKLIHIKEVLARTVRGTNQGVRVRKETKNGKVRMIPLTDDLQEVIKPLLEGREADALVFQSFSGGAIDDRMFQRRVFKPILRALGIANRDLYACRHTFGSRCIDQGITPVMTAFLMGNNPETALRNYTHQINLPTNLPDVT